MKKIILSVALSLAFLVSVTPGFSLEGSDTDDVSGPVNGVISKGAAPTTYTLPPSSLAKLFADSDDEKKSPEEKAKKIKKALKKSEEIKDA